MESFINIAGKEIVVTGNSNIVSRSFLTLIREVDNYLQVFYRKYITLKYVFSSFYFLYILYIQHLIQAEFPGGKRSLARENLHPKS